ncbi:MAG: DegT/DnrJ/EryC1/StrS family aminotransferase [Clostridia bacterium]|nr:DegT/DnrJ/EryC1/StrS family aminotransferase [Clostridia bacterium]
MRKVLNAEIYSAIKKYSTKKTARLSMPGHKGRNFLFKSLSRLDFTEVEELDIFSAVKSAEKDLAKSVNASFCRILSDGATCGILSMISAVKNFGNKLVISKNSHKSVYSGLKIFGIEPIILESQNSFSDICPKELEKSFENNSSLIGVLLNGIDYFGKSACLNEVKNVCLKHNKLLLCDNAHGAHLYLKDFYAGNFADVWVDGAHKSLLTLNQGAIIFVKNENLVNLVESGAETFSTSSPSYPTLASVEYGFKFFNLNYKLYLNAENKVLSLAEKLNKIGIKTEIFQDKLKLNVLLAKSGISVEKLRFALKKYRVDAELINKNVALFMFSPFNLKKDYSRLYKALKSIEKSQIEGKQVQVLLDRKMPYLTAINGPFKLVEIDNAIGKVSACDVGVFPPCTPKITAGEEISFEIIQLLKGENVFGLENGKIRIVGEKDER